uniref:PITPNM family member 3 n=2 Tax=Erpetoichthys calabaricus TaxID=27687 RepID=A0A8C4S769_ERPCA
MQRRGRRVEQNLTYTEEMAKEDAGKATSRKHSLTQWRMQNLNHESVDSSDEEFFDAREEVMDGKNVILLGMSQWNSNDLVEQIETLGNIDQSQESLYRVTLSRPRCTAQSSIDGVEDIEMKCKTHMLILVLHGGSILDSGGGDPSAKMGDLNMLNSVFEKVTQAHFPAAYGHILLKLVPCPAICSDAFALVSNLNPYSYDESCLSNSIDHIPLAALPLLAISSPQYQDAIATVISRSNQTYHDFLKSEDGAGFSGQVYLIGDCIGGILGFDALCFSYSPRGGSQISSRHDSMDSLQDNPGFSGDASPKLSSSKRLSKSNIDISGLTEEATSPRQPLARKQSDSSTYDCDNFTQHHTFLTSLLQEDSDLRQGSSSSLLISSPGKFDFEISDFFIFGSPLGLVLAMRKTVLPGVQVTQVRPACNQLYSLFHPADPSASRLEPLLDSHFHELAPFAVPRYQRYPLGDGRSHLLADAIHSNQSLFVDSNLPQLPSAPASPNIADAASSRRSVLRKASLTSIGSE